MKKQTYYWQIDFQSNSGWKTKYLFADYQTILKYIIRYVKDKKFYATNLSLEQVKILELLYKTEFKVVNL